MDGNILKTVTHLRHMLHLSPELSLHEQRTKVALIKFLKTQTTIKVVERGRWFYALHSGSGKGEPIAFRADMDALPIDESGCDLQYKSKLKGVSHKCGHDGHCAILEGLAMELEGRETPGDVYLIFQHAEEIGAGGEECAQLIEEKGIKRVYALHNWNGFPENSVVVRSGVSQCASMGLTVRFRGVRTHASQPELGKNPAEAVARLAMAIDGQNRPPESTDGMVLCTIVHMLVGSRDFGCSPADGELSVTLRTDYERDLDRVNALVRETSENLAKEYGLSVSFEESDRFPETLNDAAEAERVADCAKRLGLEVVRPKRPLRASEDFGHFLKKCPGAIFYIGNGVDYPALHSLDYDFNDSIIETGVDMFLELIKG